MGLADRRSFLQITGASAASIFFPDSLLAYIGPRKNEDKLMAEMIANPNDVEKGKALIEKLVVELYGSKAYDDVEKYHYDPDSKISISDYSTFENNLANNPEYFAFIKKSLADSDFLNETINIMSGWDAFKHIPINKRGKTIEKLLSKDTGIHTYISLDVIQTQADFKKHAGGALGRAIQIDHFPGKKSKSNVYFYPQNFMSLYIAPNENNVITIDENEFYLGLKTKPTKESLAGVIVHEVTHAQDSNKGMEFSNGFILHPLQFMFINIEALAAVTESRAYFAELNYLRQFNPTPNRFHPAYMSQIFYIAKQIKGWEYQLKQPSPNKLEYTIKQIQLEEVNKTKVELNSVMNSLSIRVEDLFLAIKTTPHLTK